jgi:hypothetical protein
MGIGRQKAHHKQHQKKMAKLNKRNNNAKIIATHKANAAKEDRLAGITGGGGAAADGDGEEANPTGRARHAEKVAAKRAIRDMLNYKKHERLAIKKSSTGTDEKTMRRALCDEIKVLKVNDKRTHTRPFGGTARHGHLAHAKAR